MTRRFRADFVSRHFHRSRRPQYAQGRNLETARRTGGDTRVARTTGRVASACRGDRGPAEAVSGPAGDRQMTGPEHRDRRSPGDGLGRAEGGPGPYPSAEGGARSRPTRTRRTSPTRPRRTTVRSPPRRLRRGPGRSAATGRSPWRTRTWARFRMTLSELSDMWSSCREGRADVAGTGSTYIHCRIRCGSRGRASRPPSCRRRRRRVRRWWSAVPQPATSRPARSSRSRGAAGPRRRQAGDTDWWRKWFASRGSFGSSSRMVLPCSVTTCRRLLRPVPTTGSRTPSATCGQDIPFWTSRTPLRTSSTAVPV